jgi:hypothetical protein
MHVHLYEIKHAHKHAHHVPRDERRRAGPGAASPGQPGPGYPALARLDRLISWPPVNASHSDAYVPRWASSSS